MLALFEQLNLFKKLQGKPARGDAKPDADPVFTRIDPEIDEIRNGNVDTGCSVADKTPSKPVFPNFIKSSSWKTIKPLSRSCQPVHQLQCDI